MTVADSPTEEVRRRIESLGSRLSLPTVIRALGMLEGEHPSAKRGSGYDFLDIHPYQPGEEARRIDWKATARAGRPMIVDKERESNGTAWLMLDVGREMLGICPDGERAIDVAANALRMVAALSLRRSDELSLVLADASAVSRIPFSGGFAKFEHTFDRALDRDWRHGRDIDALVSYLGRIRDPHALVVIATDECAWKPGHVRALRTAAGSHPLIVVSVATLNPFVLDDRFNRIVDASSGRRVPAFMRMDHAARDVAARREFAASAFAKELTGAGSTVIRGGSSMSVFNGFVSRISSSLTPVAPAVQPVATPQGKDGGR